MGVSLTTIMNQAGWSRGSTFTRHYLKNIEQRDPTKSSKKQIVDDLVRSTRNPVLTGAKGGRGLDAGRKVKKFAQLWSRDASILATSTPASSVADMSEVMEGSVEFISDGSFLSTSSVYLNESKNLDTSLQMNSSLEEPVVRNLVLPQSDHINPTSIIDSLENNSRGRMTPSPPVISLDHGLDHEVDSRNDLVPPLPGGVIQGFLHLTQLSHKLILIIGHWNHFRSQVTDFRKRCQYRGKLMHEGNK